MGNLWECQTWDNYYYQKRDTTAFYDIETSRAEQIGTLGYRKLERGSSRGYEYIVRYFEVSIFIFPGFVGV